MLKSFSQLYAITLYTGENMSPILNLKIDNNLTGYKNQQQITVLRAV